MPNKHRNVSVIFSFIAILMVVPSICSSFLYQSDLISSNGRLSWKNDAFLAKSGLPGFSQPIIATPAEISPRNHDGINDQTTLSFKPLSDGMYNLSIEEDIRTVDLQSSSNAMAGNSSKLLMLNEINTEPLPYIFYYNISARFSTDLGKSWTSPVLTNLSDYSDMSHTGYYFTDLDMVYNATEGSYILAAMKVLSSYNYGLYFYKSFDGIHWRLLNGTTSFPNAFAMETNFDVVLSTNRSEVIGIATSTSTDYTISHVYMLKLRQGGKSLQVREIFTIPLAASSDVLSPAISQFANHIACTWFKHEGGVFGYYSTWSGDNGQTWSSPVLLDKTRGWGVDDTPFIPQHECRSMQLNYEPSGKLDVTAVMNKSDIYTAQSSDDGAHWTNMTALRSYPGLYTAIYSLHVIDLDDGNRTMAFIASLDGYPQSAYFLLVKTVYSFRNMAVTAVTGAMLQWNGKDRTSKFVRDGPYLARAWIGNGTRTFNPVPSETKVKVDNTMASVFMTLSNPSFSPASLSSPSVKHTTSISVSSAKDGFFDVFCRGQLDIRPETRATTADVGDFRGDVAIDQHGRLYCVFVSYSSHNRDISMTTSDDYGNSFSVPVSLVTTQYDDDCPAIAIHGNEIYVVFMQIRPNEYGSYISDICMITSQDLGLTWNQPRVIVNAYTSNEFMVNPDIISTPNGSIFVAYCYSYYTSQVIKAISSSDGGMTFSLPVAIYDPGYASYPAPVSLAFDANHDELLAASENMTYVSFSLEHVNVILCNSTTWGKTWSIRNTTRSVVDEGEIGGNFHMRGVTLDVLANGTFRCSAIGQMTSLKIGTIQSNNQGKNWEYLGNTTQDSVITVDNDYYHDDLRSGQAPNGDIFYAYSRAIAPNPIKNVYIKGLAATRQHFSGSMSVNATKTVTWNGKDFWGYDCEDGNYTISAVLLDQAGNPATVSQQCTIDNMAPVIKLARGINIETMLPTQPELVAVENNGGIVDYSVDLYYKISEDRAYTRVSMHYNGTAFENTIPVSTTNDVLFYFNATDKAGNSAYLPVAGAGSPWSYFKPMPFVIISSSEGLADRRLDGIVTIEVQGLPSFQLKHVFFAYEFDNETTFTSIELTFDNNSLDYVGHLKGSQQYASLSYQIYIVRNGSTINEIAGNPGMITQVAIPLFPEFNIVYPWNVIIAVISSIFGIVLGGVQAHGKRTTKKKIQARFVNMLQTHTSSGYIAEKLPERNENDSKASTKQLVRGRLMYDMMSFGTFLTIGGGLLAALVLRNGGVGMLISALGLLLSSLALVERVDIDASDANYLEKERTAFLTFLHLILIIVVLVIFMISAPLVSWFNYYVIQQPYTIGPVTIPRLYISLVTPVITSMALIVITSYSDLKNVLIKIGKMQAKGSSWKAIWQQKEDAVARLATDVAFKVFIFLVTIAFAVISTTQLGRYAEQGMLILVPFIITWLAIFLISSIKLPGKDMVKEALDKWLIEPSKECPNCGESNLFESMHCTACGQSFAGESRIVEETVECSKCKEKSPAASKYCRGCGVEL